MNRLRRIRRRIVLTAIALGALLCLATGWPVWMVGLAMFGSFVVALLAIAVVDRVQGPRPYSSGIPRHLPMTGLGRTR
jgi:hypothetical protein